MLVCVDNDQLFPDDVREAAEQYMKANSIEHDIKIHPGVPHGTLLFTLMNTKS